MMTSGPADDLRAVALPLLDLRLTSTPIPLTRVPELLRVIQEQCRVLRSVRHRLDLYELLPGVAISPAPVGSNTKGNDRIFLVHGHNLLLREEVRRFIGSLKRSPTAKWLSSMSSRTKGVTCSTSS